MSTSQLSNSSTDGHTAVVVVDGDPTIDWAVSVAADGTAPPAQRLTEDARHHARWHEGGAFALTDLVKKAVGPELEKMVRGPVYQRESPIINDTFAHYTYCTIADFSKAGDERKRWFIKDDLGFSESDLSGLEEHREPADDALTSAALKVVLLDEAGLGYGHKDIVGSDEPAIAGSDDPARPERRQHWMRVWEKAVDSPQRPWVVLRLHLPAIAPESKERTSNLLKKFSGADNKLTERVIAITDAEDLRRAGYEISRGLSWERTTQDVLSELERQKEFFSNFNRIIISFGVAGALLVEPDTHGGDVSAGVEDAMGAPDKYLGDKKATLYFRQGCMEEVPERRIFGLTSILTASVTAALTKGDVRPSAEQSSADTTEQMHDCVGDGIKTGLTEQSKALDAGFTMRGDRNRFDLPECYGPEADPNKATAPVVPAGIAIPSVEGVRDHDTWSILCDKVEADDKALHMARLIANTTIEPGKSSSGGLTGLIANLQGIPLDVFGAEKEGDKQLLVVDRSEIESLRTVRRIVDEYLRDPEKQKPRSIAVFGAPGAGKSFAIKRILDSFKQKVASIEFNLAQLSSTTDLIEALHQVRDFGLRGETPLVFWDEFDTTVNNQPLGWLRSFLSPMQDGTFQQGQVSHPIGRAIFIFAGGRYSTYDAFESAATSPEFLETKALDFISRLSGYLNIGGPNPEPGDTIGPYQLIHRALLLYTERKSKGFEKYEDDVLDAFLRIPFYRHGSRSISTIIDMSHFDKKAPYGRSALPPQTQLNLHVDADQFLDMARRRSVGPYRR